MGRVHGSPNTMRSEHLFFSMRLFLASPRGSPASSDLRLSDISYSPPLGRTQTKMLLAQPVSASGTPLHARVSGFRNLRPQAPGNCAAKVDKRTVPSSSAGSSMGSPPSSSATEM